MFVKIMNFSILKSLNKQTFMINIVRNYFRVLEVLSSLNIEFEFKSIIGRKLKMTDLEGSYPPNMEEILLMM